MPQKEPATALHNVPFRLPEDLYTAIQHAAETEARPINSQVIVLLREASRHREKQPPAQAGESA
ncbi:MAG: hypothetical protein HY731_00710 [Candidatus Tectomicrobia bacterium]|nr:hypothetical protein [Candidatus Tectomicrobia bacterium]